MTRFAWVIATYVSALAVTTTIFVDPDKRLIWNASASVPVGLYRIERGGALLVGDMSG